MLYAAPVYDNDKDITLSFKMKGKPCMINKFCIYIYLLGNYPNPTTMGSVCINAKEEKERDWGTEGEMSNPILGNWCTHRGTRTVENGKAQKERNNSATYPGPFSCLLQCEGIIWWAYSFSPQGDIVTILEKYWWEVLQHTKRKKNIIFNEGIHHTFQGTMVSHLVDALCLWVDLRRKM